MMFGDVKVQEVYCVLIKFSSMSLNSEKFSFSRLTLSCALLTAVHCALCTAHPQLCTAYFVSKFTLQGIFPCYAICQMMPHNSDKE